MVASGDATVLEKGRQGFRMDGFPAVAAFVARDPDQETYVFRKFNYLTARNLVHLQSKLARLEAELRALDAEMQDGNDLQFKLSSRDWEEFEEMAEDKSRPEWKLKQVADEMQATLAQYHSALLAASDVANLQRPTKRVVDAFRLELADMNICGYSQTLLDDHTDLVALKAPAEKDALSGFLRDHWPFPAKDLGTSHQQQARHFEDKHLRRLVAFLSLLIASVLLVGSIVLLYLIQPPNIRLGLVIMFVVLFALGIRVSTDASRDSIFTATAAYAAVLVVFVSGNLGNAKPD